MNHLFKSLTWTKLRKFLLTLWLLICVLFVWGAAANTGIGFSAFILGIPFVWLIFSQSRHLQKQYRILLLCLALLPLIATFIFPAATSHVHYPAIGTEVVVPAGWGSITYLKESTAYLSSPEDLSRKKRSSVSREGYQTKVFPTTITMRMSGVKTQIPDFGLVYYAVLETPSGDTYEIREQDFLTAIKSGHLFAPAFNDIEALHRPMMKNLGDLMYWPVAPLFAASWVNSAIRSTLNML